jgi:hypothetical protein
MTVVVSYSSSWFAISVSDRRTTVQSELHDGRANKAIILIVDDGCFTITYTGPAYVEGVPTDSWLARFICAPYGDVKGMATGVPVLPHTLHAALAKMVVGLKKSVGSYSGLWRHEIEISVSGMRFYKGFSRPYSLLIFKKNQCAHLIYSCLPDRVSKSKQFYLWVSGGWAMLVQKSTIPCSRIFRGYRQAIQVQSQKWRRS